MSLSLSYQRSEILFNLPLYFKDLLMTTIPEVSARNSLRTDADRQYQNLLHLVDSEGSLVEGRKCATKSLIGAPDSLFNSFPLITVRKTSVFKALREMEWFLSGDSKCPDDLQDWWRGQLNKQNHYLHGYGHQLRTWNDSFDQIQTLISSLKSNPTSRRLLLSTWNPEEMYSITETNNNKDTPTCCHNTVSQFFIRDNKLHMITYQRSCDLLLGAPHNYVQTWAMLLWIAFQVDPLLKIGSLIWKYGDAHIYQREDHLNVLREIINTEPAGYNLSPTLVYKGVRTSPFYSRDFEIEGRVPSPTVLIRPTLV